MQVVAMSSNCDIFKLRESPNNLYKESYKKKRVIKKLSFKIKGYKHKQLY